MLFQTPQFLILMLVPDVGRRFWSYSNDRLKFCAVPQAAEPPPAAHAPPAAAPGVASPQGH